MFAAPITTFAFCPITYPSDRRSVRDFGRHLPNFLKQDAGFAKHPELAEIAALENALNDAFDGPDAEPLGLAELAQVAPEIWPRLVFKPHPRAVRLTFLCRGHLVGAARRDRPAKGASAAKAASHPRLAARCDRAFQAAWPRGGADVG